MGRRKQGRPQRSRGIEKVGGVAELDEKSDTQPEKDEVCDYDMHVKESFFVDLDRASWVSAEHYDISEIVLSNLSVNSDFYDFSFKEEFLEDSRYLLRFRLSDVGKFLSRMKLGHWPVFSTSTLVLEFVERRVIEAVEQSVVMVSGNFDGPDEAVTSLVHLASLNFLVLRPVSGITRLKDLQSVPMRVDIMPTAFAACDSLLDNSRHPWKKSMMNVMNWLRPEVMTSEARYGYSSTTDMNSDSSAWEENETPLLSRKRAQFDVAAFYEAIRPSKEEPMVDDNLQNLLPELRPFQRRAVYWMIQREKGITTCLEGNEMNKLVYPLCMPINLIEKTSTIYYNPFCGNISLIPEYPSSYISGGILADEMGLGKTVELLACIFAHQMSSLETSHNEIQAEGNKRIALKRLKRERVECECGALSESYDYEGLWVQCDVCDAWQHADCVGFSAKQKTSVSINGPEEQKHKKKRRKKNVEIVVVDGVHVCCLCSELIQATESPVATGATLIVCPTPILSQWHEEILRHTNPGSLKICVYEGVKDTSFLGRPFVDISELVDADIVLTTYDVLKEDLSHDSDRCYGDRRSMRFEKRYPVVPTLLTRILWWRICLDEAQMVESNAASATEMALRLPAKYRWCITGTPIQKKLDDLYGLLKFLKASPFDVFRWWAEVIRDPYEAGDVGAMIFTHKFFKNIMWRTSKVHVTDELKIPPQEECISWLTLSPIEEHFYQKQYETCVNDAHEVVRNLKDDVLKRKVQGSKPSDVLSERFITHLEHAKLFNSLLKLRQACCHPQVGSSGLRSLQRSPMTMEEILLALIGKTKIEGEEALRGVVSAINGLAGIAILKQDFQQAVSLYEEALALAEEHSEDFRLDPLLRIHIHYNLAETLQSSSNNPQQASHRYGSSNDVSDVHELDERDHQVTSAKFDAKNSSLLIESEKLPDNPFDAEQPITSQFTSDQLRTSCETLKQKFLCVFYSKLSAAQQDLRRANEQVCNGFRKLKNPQTTWWLDALHQIEQNKDMSNELIRKIREALAGSPNTSCTSRIASSFRSIATLKYYIQTGWDSLEESRKSLFDRLMAIDSTMENPRAEDIERVRHCPICYEDGDGPLCIHCELEELFQVYEARLFHLEKARTGERITSAEEAMHLHKKKFLLNRKRGNLSNQGKNSTSNASKYEDEGKKRGDNDSVVVSKVASEFEKVLGIIKNNSKGLLEKEGTLAATNQLMLLEGMRKEYTQARFLVLVQIQVLQAQDEVKMAMLRLRLREDENDNSVNALMLDELEAVNAQNSGDKFLAFSSLSRIKGQLRYLKGLVESKQSLQLDGCKHKEPSLDEHINVPLASPVENGYGCQTVADDDMCPVCQEKLQSQRMVFQCGHFICFKCLIAITEKKSSHHGNKWVMCPTCRQHTDYANIAYAVDSHNSSDMSSSIVCENPETSIPVKGSYSTKIEAVTRRILSIKSTDREAKILVFTSWNDVLDVLEHAFLANSIRYIRMGGGRKAHTAISHFRGQNDDAKMNKKQPEGTSESSFIQVLLLLIQHGANGLNLLEAQHVILVEPLLNPASEAQAIGRVHRIGQKNKTLVHRFIVKDTVEEGLHKLNRSRNGDSFISGNRRNQDHPLFTVKDVESLFREVPSAEISIESQTESLKHLPPNVAAVMAAKRRLTEGTV